MKRFIVRRKTGNQSFKSNKNAASNELTGSSVFFEIDGQKMAGKVSKVREDSSLEVKLAIPSDEGLLVVTDNTKILNQSDVEKSDILTASRKVMAFEDQAPMQVGDKTVAIRDENNQVSDYRDVEVFGLASTFETVTRQDRDGDSVAAGAFDNSLV